jgi:hypothetical protein
MLNAETLVVRFYENSYQYNAIEVLKPVTLAEIAAGVLTELNHQYNYRPTKEALWAVVLEGGEKVFQISRVDAKTVGILDYAFEEKYQYNPTQQYIFTRVARW